MFTKTFARVTPSKFFFAKLKVNGDSSRELKSGVGDSSRAFSTVLELEQAQEGLLGLKSGVGDPSRAFSTVLELKKAQEGVLGPYSTVLELEKAQEGLLELKSGVGDSRPSPPCSPFLSSTMGFWNSSRVSETLLGPSPPPGARAGSRRAFGAQVGCRRPFSGLLHRS